MKILALIVMLLASFTAGLAQTCESSKAVKDVFRQFSPYEQAEVWQAQMRKVLGREDLDWGKRQKVSTVSDLLANGYQDNQELKDFLLTLGDTFTKQEIFEYFQAIEVKTKIEIVDFKRVSLRDVNCTCSEGWTCGRGCKSPSACESCPGSGGCVPSNWGCGPLWLYGCTGLCVIVY